jgi:hypothetical protein
MKKELFEELVASVKEMSEILKPNGHRCVFCDRVVDDDDWDDDLLMCNECSIKNEYG